jgi:DedD protein
MAAAVILIPEMLSGPERRDEAPREQVAGAPALKTFTIDLNQPTSDAQSATAVDERAPPPETQLRESAPPPETSAREPVPAPQANPENEGAPPAKPMPDRPPAPTPKAVVDAPTSKPSAAPTSVSSAPKTPESLASRAPAPTTRGWAVQIGSFSREDTAERLVAELRSSGQAAFVMPLVRAQGSTLYRVRVGPMKDRASAEAALGALKGKAPGATVVSHP